MSSVSRAAWVRLLDERLRSGRSALVSGRVASVRGGLVEACICDVVVGQLCEIEVGEGSIRAEVVGLEGARARFRGGARRGLALALRFRFVGCPVGASGWRRRSAGC